MSEKQRREMCVRRAIKKKYIRIVSDVQFSWAMVAEATEIETRSTLTKVFEKFIQHDSAA